MFNTWWRSLMNKIKSRGPKTDLCGTPYFNCLLCWIGSHWNYWHSILQVRTKSVISSTSNTIIVQFSEKYTVVDSVKCLLQVKKYSTSILPRITGLLDFFCGMTVPKTKLFFQIKMLFEFKNSVSLALVFQ